jgi:integrative and conjugative element protein (TIGR02256 family)
VTLWLSAAANRRVLELGTAFHPLETGGVMLGWHDGDDRIVARVIGPGPRATHGRHAFAPDYAWQLEQIGKAFSATVGDLDYLGDWHTHPDMPAVMSKEDHMTLGRIGKRVPRAAMLIASLSEERFESRARTYCKPGLLARSRSIETEARIFEPPEKWGLE